MTDQSLGTQITSGDVKHDQPQSALPLFRQEVVRARADRLVGTVMIGIPLTWQIVSAFLFVSVGATVILLYFIPYAEVTMLPATLVPDHGSAKLVSTRSGVVTAVMVTEGARVHAGTPLISIRNEEAMADGLTSASHSVGAIRSQRLQLDSQMRDISTKASAEDAQTRDNIAGLNSETKFLNQQIETQRQLVSSAAADIARVESIARGGFISARDMQARKDALLSRYQQLAQLEQSRAAKQGDLARARHSAMQTAAENHAQVAQLQVAELDLDSKLAAIQASSVYVLVAPISGISTAISVRVGDHVPAEHELATVIPISYRFEAEFFVPTSGAGQIHSGQEVRLSVDSFPYERYGNLSGRIREISYGPVPGQNEKGKLAYRVRATLSDASLKAFAPINALRPGMTMTARIVSRKQSLLRWLMLPAENRTEG